MANKEGRIMNCKCVIKETWIGPGRYGHVNKFCPLHAAAGELLRTAKALIAASISNAWIIGEPPVYTDLVLAIGKAEGRNRK